MPWVKLSIEGDSKHTNDHNYNIPWIILTNMNKGYNNLNNYYYSYP